MASILNLMADECKPLNNCKLQGSREAFLHFANSKLLASLPSA
jgi:hypothetical protein